MMSKIINIHLISIPIYLYYKKYLVALITSLIYIFSFLCWKKNKCVMIDQYVARTAIIGLNLYVFNITYTLLSIFSVLMYCIGNYILHKYGKFYSIFWSFNHLIGTILNIYFFVMIDI